MRTSDLPGDGARAVSDLAPTVKRPHDLQRVFQLVLATIWLLDAVLQLQPFMFTAGTAGFSGLLASLGAANHGWVAHTITWDASQVDHHAVAANSIFAGVQFLIAFGIAWHKTVKAALSLSVVWALLVWWFGEGLGLVLVGGATPLGGGPGGVLFYGLVGVLLWPRQGSDAPFVAARSVGERPAKVIWLVTWVLIGVLAVVGSGRSPEALHDLVAGTASGEPGWLASIDRASAHLLADHGTGVAIGLSVLCVVVGLSVFGPPRLMELALVVVIVVFGLIWVSVQNFGGILLGGATDPNSGPLVVLLCLLYWPRRRGSVKESPSSPRAHEVSAA